MFRKSFFNYWVLNCDIYENFKINVINLLYEVMICNQYFGLLSITIIFVTIIDWLYSSVTIYSSIKGYELNF